MIVGVGERNKWIWTVSIKKMKLIGVGYQIYHSHNDGFGLNTLRLYAVSVSKPSDQD
jgi:hypothetical protein